MNHESDLTLAQACGHGDPEALREFEQRFAPVAQRALARFGGGTAFVADALQELRVRLFTGPRPRILDYAGSGPLEAWVKITAVRVAINLRERDDQHRPSASSPAGDDERAIAALNDPELEHFKLRYRDGVLGVLRDAFAALPSAERILLKLYLVDKLNIAEIGNILGTSRATVGRQVVALRERLLEDTRERLSGSLGIAGNEVDSVLRLVRSRLDLTLSRILSVKTSQG